MNPMVKLLAVAMVGLLAAACGAKAATTPNTFVTAQTPNRGIVQFLQGTDVAGTYKTIYTASANGSKCRALWSTNNDPSATHLLTVQIVNGGVKYGGMAITSVLSAGFANATPAQNLISAGNWPGLPLDSDGNPYIFLASGDTLQATFATAITSTDVINIVANCDDY